MKKLVTATLFVAFILGITIFLLIDDEENQTQSTPITDERVPVIPDSEVSEEKNSLNIELIRVLQLDLSKLAEETFTMNIEEIRVAIAAPFTANAGNGAQFHNPASQGRLVFEKY